MIKTHGLTHISLAVRDPDRSLGFYQKVFGVKEYYRDENSIQVLGPGSHDVIAFEKDSGNAGRPGGIAHFGFRLIRADDIDAAVEEVKGAGGEVLRRGEFAPGYPFAYVADPDGYEIEIWYE
jgi:catechol 2,3-dioxygenase-like lactoylglutathione lyase family enzyme